MKKNAMRTIAIWMVLALCLALVPMQAYAEEAAAEEKETVQAAEPEGKKEEPAEKETEKPTPAAEDNSEEEEPLEEVLSDELVVAEGPETGDDNADDDHNIKEEESAEGDGEGEPADPENEEVQEAEDETADPENQEEKPSEPETEEQQEPEEGTSDPENQEEEPAEPEEEQEQEEEEAPVEDTGVYAKGAAKLYEKPSTDSELLATLDHGTVLILYETEGDWALVQAGDLVGYIFRDEISGVKFPAREEKEDTGEAEENAAEGIPAEEDAADAEPAEIPEDTEAEESEAQENGSQEPAEAETAEVKVRSVKISSNVKKVMTLGETVTLFSQLNGFEDCEEIYYQWEVDKGNGFEAVAGATSGEYSFPATQETLSWSWRLSVKCR